MSLFYGLPNDVRGGVTGNGNITYFFKGNYSKTYCNY